MGVYKWKPFLKARGHQVCSSRQEVIRCVPQGKRSSGVFLKARGHQVYSSRQEVIRCVPQGKRSSGVFTANVTTLPYSLFISQFCQIGQCYFCLVIIQSVLIHDNQLIACLIELFSNFGGSVAEWFFLADHLVAQWKNVCLSRSRWWQ